MAVSTETVLQKMKQELAEAQQSSADQATMKKHIANIQLLCELLMEEEPSSSEKQTSRDITAKEMKAMMGNKSVRKGTEPEHTINHEGANGESIFDF
ncbi:hypothetical protein SAMN05216238_10832 [Lentibacillus persicus]|uniref:YwdI family protein n=1 Tax=Lentibacillus persicus TaxID=640948 RepID=A0A1I1XLJ4_9BACI|nr:DUF5327 family protein [Lentibacillus persicus]SFE08294.1 hypothetical protein SAMN05216238_10832 [Lentibacillus persicus]